jgi:protein-L-isoaspartate(D-aspartate) O-methyltransferase
MKSTRDGRCDDLLEAIDEHLRETRDLTGCTALDARVRAALRRVPRHVFVPDELQAQAYADHPLPIGHGQTISQPTIVALMSELIAPHGDAVVLEVGTGSGYQTAILAELCAHVYSIEIVTVLAQSARQRLQRLGYENIDVRAGDGRLGWPEHAPYDAIMVTAAPDEIPPALIEQLRPGGTLVIPVGERYFGQQLLRVRKNEDGSIEQQAMLPVIFVPLTGGTAQ